MSKKKEIKHCPECDSEISLNAKRCPHCRKNLRNWFRRHPILSFLLFLFLFPFFLFPIFEDDNSSVKTKTTNTIQTIEGGYSDYKYSIIKDTNKNEYIASFSPFLPPNDTTLTGAMLSIITDTYGKHKLSNLTPDLVPRNGVNLIRFSATDYYYFFSPIKEDTGEIHTLVFWREVI